MNELIMGGIVFILGILLLVKGFKTFGEDDIIWKKNHARRTSRYKWRGFLIIITGVFIVLVALFNLVFFVIS